MATSEKQKAYSVKYQKEHRAQTLAIQRHHHWKDNYGIAPWQYHVTLEMQGGRCAICKTDLPDLTGRQEFFSIDHNHTTGSFRGLLCVLCNTGVGAFKDSPALLKQAGVYLGN